MARRPRDSAPPAANLVKHKESMGVAFPRPRLTTHCSGNLAVRPPMALVGRGGGVIIARLDPFRAAPEAAAIFRAWRRQENGASRMPITVTKVTPNQTVP